MGLVAGAVLLAGIGGGAFWALTAPEASAAQIRLESVSSSGSLPFGAPAGNDDPDVQAPDNAGGELPGNTGGLYAAGASGSPCDAGALVAGVTSDPAKAAAWAAPMGIAPGRIGSFVGSLSAVTLRADTAVTQYGYAAGQFQPYPAVLQAGTAVLVNRYGEPTVKCYNANPLGAPTGSNTVGSSDGGGVVVGTPWPAFTVERTVTVVAASAPQKRLEVVDPRSNTQKPEEVPPQPPDLPATPNPAPPTTPDKQLLLTGVHNYDNTITLSDGRVITNPGGEVVPPKFPANHPPGSTTNPDGSITEPNGLTFNADNSPRLPVTNIAVPGLANTLAVGPNGVVTNVLDGKPAGPFQAVWNHDGTFTLFIPGGASGFNVVVYDANGKVRTSTPVPEGSVVQKDGSILDPVTGNVTNPNGTSRQSSTLPGGVVLDQKGGNTPPKEADEPVDPGKPQVQLGTVDQKQEAGGEGTTPPENGGVVPPAQNGQAVPPPVDKDGAPVVPGEGGNSEVGTKAVDCAATPAAAGCQEKPVVPAPKPDSATPAEPGTGETGRTGQTGGDGGGTTGGGTGDGGGGDGGGGSGGGGGGGSGGGGGDGGGN